MKTTKLMILMMVLLLGALITSCGSDDNAAPAQTTTEQTAPQKTEGPKPTTTTTSGYGSKDFDDFKKKVSEGKFKPSEYTTEYFFYSYCETTTQQGIIFKKNEWQVIDCNNTFERSQLSGALEREDDGRDSAAEIKLYLKSIMDGVEFENVQQMDSEGSVYRVLSPTKGIFVINLKYPLVANPISGQEGKLEVYNYGSEFVPTGNAYQYSNHLFTGEKK